MKSSLAFSVIKIDLYNADFRKKKGQRDKSIKTLISFLDLIKSSLVACETFNTVMHSNAHYNSLVVNTTPPTINFPRKSTIHSRFRSRGTRREKVKNKNAVNSFVNNDYTRFRLLLRYL